MIESKFRDEQIQYHNIFGAICNDVRTVIKQHTVSQRIELNKTNLHGEQEIVTQYDRAIEQIATQRIKEVFPQVTVIGEETFTGDHSVFDSDFYFVIDPIDGTAQFVKGNPYWSVSICAVKEHEPIAAMLFFPELETIMTATKGSGLRINNRQKMDTVSRTQMLAVSPVQILDTGVQDRISSLGYKPHVIPALTPKIYALLSGDVDACISFKDGRSSKIWDYAAAVLLVKEAGGIMRSLSGGELAYSGAGIVHTDGWIAVQTAELYAELQSKVIS